MSKVRIFITFFSILILVQGLNAQTQNPEALLDMLNLIRKEKINLVLPQVMRDNNVDMWIHVMRSGNPDPLRIDLGGDSGVFIFTDRGGDRIERAVFGTILDTGRSIEGSRGESAVQKIRQFVSERDPKSIAVNSSDWIAIADGISHADYLKLVDTLGDKYADRLVSSENVITDFRMRRVMSEIVFYGELCKLTVEMIEKALDIIETGVTTLKDVSLWLRDWSMARGFGSGNKFGGAGVFLRYPYGDENDADDHVIQGGDLIHVDFGVQMMNYGTDIKRVAYILREGETELPPEIQNSWDHALKAREVFRRNIKVGRTAGETLEIIENKLEEAGYFYNPADEYDRNADPEKTQIHIDMHPVGNTGHGDVAVGPRISPFVPDRLHLVIPNYFLFAFEYMIHMPVPSWGPGKHIYLAIEDDVIVTERGIEFLYPPIKQIRVIR